MRDDAMFKTKTLFAGGATIAAALAFSAPAQAQSTKEVLRGAGIGAAGGAVAGAVIPGLGVGEGALIGAAGGTAVTALTKGGHRWYRDSNGRKYWLDKRGRRHYRR
jgi:hypothetical protein